MEDNAREKAHRWFLEGRRHLDRVWDNLSYAYLSDDGCSELIGYERFSEDPAVRCFIIDYIYKRGLEAHLSDILGGIDQTLSRVVPNESRSLEGSRSLNEWRCITHSNTDTTLEFAFDYVDKWAMYNNLFGGQKSE